MQVVEVMIVGLLVVAAVVAVSTMNVPVTETEGFKQDNERLVKDSLQAMLARPSELELFGSLLEHHVMEAIAGDPGPLMDHLNKTLPGGAQYNVYLDNHHGPPIPLVEQGVAPREAVAGSIQFVPKLAYTFTIPEFALYHGDFKMNVYSVPVQNGVLLHDEGEPVELAVTIQAVDDNEVYVDEPVVVKTYSHTALRKNDPTQRSWPSVSLWYEDQADIGNRRYVIDASDTPLYGDRITGLSPLSGDAYNISFTLRVEETANIKVPKNADILLEFPRGFDFNATKRNYMANVTSPEMNNVKFWKDWTFEGSMEQGWTIKAKTKDTFRDTAIWLNVSTNFRTVLDTAFPFYSPITVAMGGGVQGHTNIAINTPSIPLTGAYGREAYLSVAKPLISGDVSHWGMVFANDGAGTDAGTVDKVEIQNITLRHPGGEAIFSNVVQTRGWVDGIWKEYAPGHWWWDTDEDTILDEATQVDLAFDVTGGPTQDNSYRNQDYLRVVNRYNPLNSTTVGLNTLGEWEYEERSWRMGEEWVYLDMTPPYDDIPGWADQPGETYWVSGGTYAYKKSLPSNTTYGVFPVGAAGNLFGGYKGAHLSSELDIVNAKGSMTRAFDLGQKVHIKNDFEALFGQLSQLSGGDVAVTNLQIKTYVYTPEKAWKGIAEETFSQSATISQTFDDVAFLRSADINGDGTMDLIVVGDGGVVYALDGRDGGKFWMIETGDDATAAELVDMDDDGVWELLVGVSNDLTGAKVRSYTTTTASSPPTRLLWEKSVMPSPAIGLSPWKVTDILNVQSTVPGEPDLLVATSPSLGQSLISGLEVIAPSTVNLVATYKSAEALSTSPGTFADLERVEWSTSGDPVLHIAVASANSTVTMLSYPDLKVDWVKKTPNVVRTLIARDLDQDGHEDLLADTQDGSADEGGPYLFTITGSSGEFGPSARGTSASLGGGAVDAAFTESGAFAVKGNTEVLADAHGLYKAEWQGMGSYNSNAAYGLYGSPNGTVYIVFSDGAIYNAWKEDPTGGTGFHWNLTAPSRFPLGGPLAADIHAEPSWPDADGRMYQITHSGLISYNKGIGPSAHTWTDLASLCPESAAPDAGRPCGSTSLRSWAVDHAADGEVVGFWVLSVTDTHVNNDDDIHLQYFDIAATTWTTLHYWPGGGVSDEGYLSLEVDHEGTLWLSGVNVDGATVKSIPKLGFETQYRSMHGKDKVFVDVLIQEDGTGWAITDEKEVYRLSDGDVWVPMYLADFPTSGSATLVEDPTGTVWLVGRDFDHVPLTAYAQKAEARFGSFPANLGLENGEAEVTVSAGEGHLGGTDTPTTKRAITEVRWYAKSPNGSPVLLTPQSTPDTHTIHTVKHVGTIDCAPRCDQVEIWAELENGWRTEGVKPVTMGAASPLIKGFALTVEDPDGSGAYATDVVADASSLKDGSTAAYSSFAKGVMLAEGRIPWVYKEPASSLGVNGVVRQVAASQSSMVDGTAGSDLVIIQQTSGGWERWVLDSHTGAPERPADLSSFGLKSGDEVQGILVLDVTGDASEDIVLAGSFGDQDSAVRVWDVAAGTVHDSIEKYSVPIMAVASTGSSEGRATFAVGDDSGNVRLLQESKVTGDPVLKWKTAPATDQGKATFEYEIPLNAMYGTAVVVSELRFDLNDDAGTVTQTARLVDWFDIKPPNREVPRPPIYTVQIVSWFNEA